MEPLRKSAVDKRRHTRHPRRICCEIWIQGVRTSGIVKDVSRSGLFVHTRARAIPGAALTVVIPSAEGRTEIRIRGRVVRAERIRAHLAMQSAAGIGIEVIDPGALGRLLGDLQLASTERS
jgi:hypothetical protein